MKAEDSIRAIPNGMALKLAVTASALNRITSRGKFFALQNDTEWGLLQIYSKSPFRRLGRRGSF